MNKNPIIAFLLAFFPGGGFFYLRRFLKGFIYFCAIVGIPIVAIILAEIMYADEMLIFALLGVIIYFVSFVDTITSASRLYKQQVSGEGGERTEDTERFYAIVLSFVPGLGHFQLGLAYRGTTVLASFIGLGVMILFVTFLLGRGELLIFLAFLPIIWIYSFFDIFKLLDKKKNEEELEDTSIFEEFTNREDGAKKSKALASILSIIPGAGHLYLGLQKRGLQLMISFFLSIYILDVLRLGLFLFIIPVIWFYSFFDGLQKAALAEEGEIEDEPIVKYVMNHQKWIGIGLIAFGMYYLFVNFLLPVVSSQVEQIFNIDLYFWVYNYFQTIILCLLLILGGIKLITGKKKEQVDEE